MYSCGRICNSVCIIRVSQTAQWCRICLPMQETCIQSLGQEDPLGKEMATHSSILPGKIQGQRSLVVYSPWDCKESDRTEQLTLTFRASLVSQQLKNLPAMQETEVWSLVGKMSWRRKWQPTPLFFPGKSHGQRTLVGYSLWGNKRARHDLATKQQKQQISVSVK